MVTIMQVDRDLVPAKGRRARRQAVSEADDGGLAVLVQTGWGGIPTIEAPNVSWREVRVERVEPWSGFQLVREVGRCELGPALMWRSVRFTCSEIREFGRLRTQRMIIRRKRSCEFLHEGGMRRTVCWCNANYRLRDRTLKAQSSAGGRQ